MKSYITDVVNKSQEGSMLCPYAAALKGGEDDTGNTDDLKLQQEEYDDDSSHDTSTLLKSCPAFGNGTCPFSQCKDEEQVRKALLDIPQSHFDQTNSGKKFVTILKELHSVAGHLKEDKKLESDEDKNNDNTDDRFKKFSLTSCPVASKVKDIIPDNNNNINKESTQQQQQQKLHNSTNFTQVMEEYSLSAIMARLMIEMHNDDSESSDNIEISNDIDNQIIINNIVKEQPIVKMNNDKNIETETLKDSTITTTTTTTKRLSESFKSGTAVSHQAAEDVHFVRNFIHGKIDRTIYGELVIQLYYIYNTLEQCLQEQGNSNPILKSFIGFHNKLQRKDTLLDDLDYWHGPTKTELIITMEEKYISDATKDYVNRLNYISKNNPILLLSHSYTRYLGDLSGGKILARVAKKALQLTKNNKDSNVVDGLSFYEFQYIPSAKLFKDEYRKTLDSLSNKLNDNDIQMLVNEANVAFLLNIRLFEELDVLANVPNAQVRPLSHAIQYSNYINNSNNSNNTTTDDDSSNNKKECPFIARNKNNQNDITKNELTKVTTTSSSSEKEQQCPFLVKNNKVDKQIIVTQPTTTNEDESNNDNDDKKGHNTIGRCPWPFIILHDPVAALHDWQTWLIIGLLLCWIWTKIQ